jgi:hypothetical protein
MFLGMGQGAYVYWYQTSLYDIDCIGCLYTSDWCKFLSVSMHVLPKGTKEMHEYIYEMLCQ